MSAAAQAVATGEVSAAVVLPAHMDPDLRAGRSVSVGIISERANTTQQAAAEALTSVVSHQGARVQAAQFAASQVQGTTFDSGLARAMQLQHSLPALGIKSHQVVATANVLPEGFDYSAPTELVLFVFLSALAGGAHIIDSRRLGIYERIAAAPVSASSVILGEMLGFTAIAVMQSLLIVGVGALVFGVSWGNPLAAGVLLAVWALVGAAAGMLSGTLFRTPEQASAIGPVVGIGFAMLGGCMWPLAIVSNVMRQVGHITPQAWAVDAWTILLARHGGLGSIGLQAGHPDWVRSRLRPACHHALPALGDDPLRCSSLRICSLSAPLVVRRQRQGRDRTGRRYRFCGSRLAGAFGRHTRRDHPGWDGGRRVLRVIPPGVEI